ncbi:3-deoxy-D-manno-octulosonate 8-phosphate phosphatase [Flavobacterium noncentrifugens]|uniref:3-deoxy-D-manno-octulosonate 8-phosphate phosphatase (KDO 8-P phosphatase) n=1 Tax=Flavobacterium noncentrifugens TaxID=1128970 RepID=A0A1G8WJ94_9FLAO|nr:HAD-IIIA family hydrolase [Flavobacterium noncentrifugens]GEP50956.1 3-deoxy-D-manno-octulosonate 8-phosphate phosphatase [Flavobacterium noncentrifugens]SDJ78428.1 3-deoxy-D-manno-octulosonate 8-phosphate phosphatase (KDO 8-P phosphatase) [Flavobacterium noncentrifugens]
MAKTYKEIMNGIKGFIFDVDGVLTDSSVHITPTGEMLRIMNIRDGYAMKAAVESGYHVCIISGGSNEGVRIRLRNLGITDIHLATPDKVKTFKEYIELYHINAEEVLYMGDDIPDYHVMKLVGLPTCPQDASPEIKEISKYISHKNGGRGAVRDVIEQVMRVQGKWMQHFDGKHD